MLEYMHKIILKIFISSFQDSPTKKEKKKMPSKHERIYNMYLHPSRTNSFVNSSSRGWPIY
jgi:hypothetical protein